MGSEVKQNFILIDGLNLFFRSAHVVSPSAGIDNMIGMGFHIIFNCIKKAWKDFDGSHIVFCTDGRSWRKDIYKPYKAQRKEARAAMSERDRENQDAMLEAYGDFVEFMEKKTNVTMLYNNTLEADDLIASWIVAHPDDNHVILSTDGDFLQLLAPNVKVYNGVEKTILSVDGIFTEDGKPVIDKKTKEPKQIVDPEYFLFMKCIRGDKSDNIFSAFPGAREKGTKTKVGIIDAFEDRHQKGYKWNNFMLQRWTDHEDIEHVVKEDYERNRSLIDLHAQPDDIKERCAFTIATAVEREYVSAVGVQLMKFCGKWDLKRIGDNAPVYATMLNSKYTV